MMMMMWIRSTAFLLLPMTAGAFAPMPLQPRVAALALSLSSTSSSNENQALAAALEATRHYGADSPKARVLWDIVEELRAADSHQRHAAEQQAGLDQECLLDYDDDTDTPSLHHQDCLDYETKMAELTQLTQQYEDWRDLVQNHNNELDRFQSLTHDLRALKLKVNSAAAATLTTTPSSETETALAQAVKAAEAATAQHGATSPEARLAWETVEEVASAGLDNALGGSQGSLFLDEECLIEDAMDACVALQELNKALTDNAQSAEEQAATNKKNAE